MRILKQSYFPLSTKTQLWLRLQWMETDFLTPVFKRLKRSRAEIKERLKNKNLTNWRQKYTDSGMNTKNWNMQSSNSKLKRKTSKKWRIIETNSCLKCIITSKLKRRRERTWTNTFRNKRKSLLTKSLRSKRRMTR